METGRVFLLGESWPTQGSPVCKVIGAGEFINDER